MRFVLGALISTKKVKLSFVYPAAGDSRWAELLQKPRGVSRELISKTRGELLKDLELQRRGQAPVQSAAASQDPAQHLVTPQTQGEASPPAPPHTPRGDNR